MAAIETARRLAAEARPATASEQQVLARWSSWGAIPQVFDDTKSDWSTERTRLRELLDDDAYDAARRTTINAHYTDPAYVKQIWGTLASLGFTGGEVLEPGCGSGTFIGLAPPAARMTGVELDPTTASIAAGLYPDAALRRESFATTRFANGHFDAVVGNVPFADVALHDPRHNAGGHTMHNHFIIKSLALTRPGGMVAVLTSSFTMDATNPAARREMNAMADLVGAVRLPSGAHRRSAGTEAVTDLLILRRRPPGVPARDVTWETVAPREVDGVVIRVNNYFDEHPERVLGKLRVGTGMYGGQTVSVVSEDLGRTSAQLSTALASIAHEAVERGQVFTTPDADDTQARASAARTLTDLWDGSLVADEQGFAVAQSGQLEALAVPKVQHTELRHLLQLRDGARALVEAEAADVDDTPAMTQQRDELRAVYAAYVDRYGPLNRFKTYGTGRYEPVLDPRSGEPVLDDNGEPVRGEERTGRKTPPAMVTFRQDPHSSLVRALERFDEETQTSSPAALLQRRVVTPRPVRQGADTASEAIALSLDQTGRVELPLVARLLGVQEPEARELLGDLVYDDPATGDLVHAADYLSGDVRTKLEVAEAAAAEDPRLQINVDALRAALPDPIGVEEIEARLGSVWISPAIHRQFLVELLRDESIQVENPMPGEWEVRGRRHGIRATNEWGTERRPAPDLAQALMEQKRIEVSDEVEGPDGRKRRVLNPVETTAAQEKGEALQERFAEWVWEDPQRASELAAVYNRRFNSIRLRDYSQAGDYLTLPGLTASITLREHQRAAVARMVAEPTVGLFHQVGAGKAQPLDALVLTPSGFTTMGEIQIGDAVVTPSGDTARVAGVYPQGERSIYRIHFNDGTSVEADGEHLWEVQTTSERAVDGAWHLLTTNQIAGDLVKKNGATKWFVPNLKPADLESGGERPLDPYVLGLLLGDGSLSAQGTVGFTTADKELVDAMAGALPPGAELRQRSGNDGYDWGVRGCGPRYSAPIGERTLCVDDAKGLYEAHTSGVAVAEIARELAVSRTRVQTLLRPIGPLRSRDRNPVLSGLRTLGLMGHTSHSKFVPAAYKNAPVRVRHAVLQGLLDTDGTISRTPTDGSRRGHGVSLLTASPQLAQDVAWLVWSLGGRATIKERSKSYAPKGRGRVERRLYTYVGITLPNDVAPFRLSRKAERVAPRLHYRQYRRGIVRIEHVGRKEAQCIMVDHPSHMYVTDNFTPTHNTLEMICGATEMKRMGLVSKPAVVVPNHMLEQFSREWLQAYPRARVLAASAQELTGDKRRLFVARAAANEWDAVILTQGAFKKIGLSPEFEARYVDRQLDELRASLEAAREADGLSVKRIEKRILAVEERHKKALAMPRDPGVNFQDTGIDYLVVDEAHMYKNLATVSNIRDAAIEGSQQATDLHMKLEYLRERHGDRVATMATATPLANSVTEAYVMQRYLRPDLLAAAGVTSFDGWAATFGSQVTEMEMGPAGGFRLKTRFAKFQNVPEMLRMWHVFADVKTAEDLDLPVPQLAPRRGDGARQVETVVLQPTPELEDYIGRIADRAEKVAARQVDNREDNMLMISTDGRKAALDLRLVDQTAVQSGTVKLDAVASRVLEHWRATRDNVYLDETTGEPSPVRGALQLVFSDLGTPNETRWDAYTELRSKLVEGGMAPDSIRFIHEAANDSAKARLFASARAGHVAVLIGSTAKMGVGTNVQNRLSALHHVDCPWRPADLEQRDGRGIRQGNQNDEVAVLRYVVERSFDAYSWQTVGRKATFIAQVMRGRLDTREIEDIGDTALSAAEAKALASGNPLVLEKANAEADYQKLRRQEVAHHRAQSALRATRGTAELTVDHRVADLTALRAAAERTREVAGDAFSMSVDGTTFTSRSDAAAAVATWATRNQHLILSTGRRDSPLLLGSVGGHEITVSGERAPAIDRSAQHLVTIGLRDVPGSEHRMELRELTAASVGVIRSLENKTTAIPRRIASYEGDVAGAEHTIGEVDAKLGQPFPHAAQLRAAKDRLDAVNAELAAQSESGGAAELSPAARTALEASGLGRRATAETISAGRGAEPGSEAQVDRSTGVSQHHTNRSGPAR